MATAEFAVLGVGLAMAAMQVLLRRNDHESIALQRELLELVQLGKDGDVTMEELRYYISTKSRVVLRDTAYMRLKREQFNESTIASQFSASGQVVLLSGQEEVYHQRIVKALAHDFGAKLLLLDVTHLESQKVKMFTRKSNTGPSPWPSALARDICRGMASLFATSVQSKHPSQGAGSSLSSAPDPKGRYELLNTDCVASAEKNEASGRTPGTPGVILSSLSGTRRHPATFDIELFVDALFEVLRSLSETSPVVVYLRNVDRFFFREGQNMYSQFTTKMKDLRGPIMILGSRIKPPDQNLESNYIKQLEALFRYRVDVIPPKVMSASLTVRVEEHMKAIQAQDYGNHIIEVLYANDLECEDMSSVEFSDTKIHNFSSCIEEAVVIALGNHLVSMAQVPEYSPEYRAGRLLISAKSLTYALSMFQPEILDSSKKVAPENEYEKRIRSDVIPADKIDVTFQDIGSLENVKESLQELVMLPLKRPELFNRGGLIKRCKGVLLFGPPGNGKTMLAKAVAREAGASFINVSMSAITSKWAGEGEKHVKAIFSLAARLSPTVIFIDEADSLLGQRSRVGEHEAMRTIKNEFMTHWDGLLTKGGERVLVLAATNRPFDLDEAIIRRFERRFMVGLPDVENREKILRVTLVEQVLAEDFDLRELATLTEGYSGSDLKNLCLTAAYRPLREQLSKEQKKEQKAKELEAKGNSDTSSRPTGSESDVRAHEEEPADNSSTLRPLSMQDMREAKKQVSASFSVEGTSMKQLKDWNDLYGEGGSRKEQRLSYYL